MTNDISIYKCLKGHESTESDYCSECGTKITNVGAILDHAIASTISQTTTLETCPACTAPREPNSGEFCEICGYNFVTRRHGEVPAAIQQTKRQGDEEEFASLSPSSSPTPPIPPSPTPPTPPTWELTITIDPGLRQPESPEAPTNQQARAFRLEGENNLIGRNSQARAIKPEIALDFDNAVSGRHALLNLQADGTLTLRDIGSSNGTKLNGVELQPMVDVPIKDGDEFTLGHWTRIVVKAVPSNSQE